MVKINYSSCHQIQDNITRALSSDAKQVVMNGLQPSVMKEFAGSSDICGSRMEMSLCSPDANDCFNKTLTSMRNTDIQGDSVSRVYTVCVATKKLWRMLFVWLTWQLI